jgi:hypothetical protein
VALVGVALLRVGPIGLALPGLAFAGALLVVRPRVALALFLGLVIVVERGDGALLSFDGFYAPRVAGLSLASMLLAFAAVAVALEALARRRVTLVQPPLIAALGVIAAAVAAGAVTGYFAGVEISDAYDAILALAPLVIVPFLVAAAFDTRESLLRLLVFLALLAVGKACVGLAGVLGGLTSPDPALGDAEGARLTYYEPAVNFLCLVMVLVAAVAALRRVAMPAWFWATVPLVVASLLLSYRRSFWIAVALGLALVLVFGLSRLQRRMFVPVVILLAVGGWAMATVGGIGSRLEGDVADRARTLEPGRVVVNREDRYRLDERANVLAEVREHPISGLGIGVPWTARRPLPVEHEGGRQYVHAALLWFWLKFGVLGAIGYTALIATTAALALSASRRTGHAALSAVGLGAFAATLAIAVVETTATFTGPNYRFSVLMGVFVGIVSRIADRDGA